MVAGYQPALDLCGPLADRYRIDDPAAHLATAAAVPHRPARPQASFQLPAQLASRVDIDGLVDRLVADLHGWLPGIQNLQPPADLLGRVPPVQHLLHPAG